MHDGIAVAREMESLIHEIDLQYTALKCRAICTDDAGQYGRARRILALRYPHYHFVHCFAHQVNLIVKDVLKKGYGKTVQEAAAIVSKMNQSPSKWLIRANGEMKKMYGKTTALLSLIEVRWNSAQQLLASLLRVKSALISFHTRYCDDEKFLTEFEPLGDTQFWKRVARAENSMVPLTKASFIMQKNETSLAHVFVMYGLMYRSFKADDMYGDTFIHLLEKRF